MATATAGKPDSRNEYQRDYRARRTASSQEIGDIPPIADKVRRRDCLADFELYCKTYHASEFTKPWADYHRSTAARIQAAADTGGWYARALPRGGGKTTLATCGAEWVALRGSHPYSVLVGARDELAFRLLKGMKTQFTTNELLIADFPHALWPFVMLGNEARRAGGQRYHGELTAIEWAPHRLVFAWIDEPESLSSGFVIEALGITAAIRGRKHTRPDGSSSRPTFAIVDDPQTRESAKSPSQSQSRIETLTGDIAYLAGPGEPIAVVCPCTVIYEGDLADQILCRDKHPEWNGERTPMVESFPTNNELWDQYGDIWRSSLKADGDGSAATEFYRENREAMDAGAKVSWEDRHREDELSGLQHAMNLKLRDEAAFFAECQNQPVMQQDDLELLTADEIAAKITGYARGTVPDDVGTITAFTDVQGELLYWMVVGWTPDFTGYVLDYGSWPDQKRQYFTLRDSRKTLSRSYDGDEGAITFSALTDLGNKLVGREYLSTDGKALRLSRWAIDGNWRAREAAVKAFAYQSKFAPVITLTYGRGVKASHLPMSEWAKTIKWKTGPGWCWTDKPGAARGVIFDTNFWKKRVMDAFALPLGSRGALSLFKAEPQQHRMLADHCQAERPVKTESMGRTVYEWQEKPGQDNHLFDCLTGNFVAASISGISRNSERIARPARKKRERVSYL